MKPQSIQLSSDPEAALEELRSASQEHPVVVLKKSPTCPVSHHAEAEFRSWLAAHDGAPCSFAIVDVLAERPLARGLTAADLEEEEASEPEAEAPAEAEGDEDLPAEERERA